MYRKKFNYIALPLLALTLLLGGCDRFFNPFSDDGQLARVGERVLTVSDLQGIFTPGLTPEDSVKLQNDYVQMWVRKQLKAAQAEEMFPEAVPGIERLVDEYRTSLLGVKLDEYWNTIHPDTVVTDDELERYWRENARDYVLDRDIVKGRVAIIPDSYRQRARLRELMRWGKDGDEQDFREICLKGNIRWEEFSSWTDASAFLSHLPADRAVSDEKVLSEERVGEIRQGDDWYCYYVTARRRAGDQQPLERVAPTIRNVLTVRRRAEMIRSREDSLMEAARAENRFTINTDH